MGIPYARTIQYGQPQASQPPQQAPQDIYTQASNNTQQKYGVTVPPYMLKAVQQQESSGITDTNDYGRAFGLVNADGTNGAKAALGKDYLPDTSLANSAQNASNYLALRSKLKNADGSTRVDLSTPENMSKWYTQRYAGVLPKGSRMINGKNVSYDQIKASFEKLLASNQPPRSIVDLNK